MRFFIDDNALVESIVMQAWYVCQVESLSMINQMGFFQWKMNEVEWFLGYFWSTSSSPQNVSKSEIINTYVRTLKAINYKKYPFVFCIPLQFHLVMGKQAYIFFLLIGIICQFWQTIDHKKLSAIFIYGRVEWLWRSVFFLRYQTKKIMLTQADMTMCNTQCEI